MGSCCLPSTCPAPVSALCLQCLVHILMRAHNVWPYCIFYDINCRFGLHFRDMAQACGDSGLWPAALAAWGSCLLTPLPPFHKYMHTAKCAQKHTLELHKALGMGAGEPPEPANLQFQGTDDVRHFLLTGEHPAIVVD